MLEARWWVRGYRLFFALLTIATVAYNFWANLDREDFSAVNYFSFFTIQSNLIGAAVFLIGASSLAPNPPTRTWDLVRGGAVIYLALTFFVYGILLSGLEGALQTRLPWVNAVLHQIFPVVVVADLLIRPLAHRLSFRQSLIWTIYPLAYLAYSLIRGPIANWYPYPFLNPDESGGYLGVAAYCVVILIGFLAFSALIVWISNHLRLRFEDDVTPAAAGSG